jgi:hypothetical protein
MNPADVASRLRQTVTTAASLLLKVTDERASLAPTAGKWSAKQIIGHLVDSASNNHGRFVRSMTSRSLSPGS